MKKHLLILSTTFPRWRGDSEAHFVFYLAKELTKFFDVSVLVPFHLGSKRREVWDGVKVYRFRYWFKESLCYGAGIHPNFKNNFSAKLQVLPFLFSFWWNAREYAKDVDVVNAWWSVPCGFIASLLSKPYVLSTAGTDVMSIKDGLLNWFQQRAFVKAKCVTALSNFLKKEVKQRYNRGAVVIPIGIHQEDFKFKKRRFLKQRFIIFVGRLNDQKGCDVLIKAMKIIKVTGKYPGFEVCLRIVGEGEKARELQYLAADVGGNIYFKGPLPNNQLPSYYKDSYILVMPSKYYEGLGLVMIEAMASGTPVIASAVGGVPDVIKDYKTGILVNEQDPEDLACEIMNLLDDKELYSRLQDNALRHVQENFVWNKIGERFAKTLDI